MNDRHQNRLKRTYGFNLISMVLFLSCLSALSLAQIEWTPEAQVNWDDLYDDWTPMVAAGSDGKVWVVWESLGPRGDEVLASVWDENGWSYQLAVCPDDGIQESNADIAVGPDNMPWIIMVRQTGGPPYLHTSQWNGVGWDPIIPLFPDSTENQWPLAPRIAVDSAGIPFVIWSWYVNEDYDSALYYSRRIDDVWSPPEKVCPNTGQGNTGLRIISANAFGDLWVMWTHFFPQVSLISRWMDTHWAEPDTISPDYVVVSVAAGSAGQVWVSGSRDDEIWIWQCQDGEWFQPELVSNPGFRENSFSKVAADFNGSPHVVWYGREFSGSSDYEKTVYANCRIDGQWDSEQQVSTNNAFYKGYLDLAVEPDGRAWAVWHGWDGFDYEIFYSHTMGSSAASFDALSSISLTVVPYPNPTGGHVNFNLPGERRSQVKLRIFDISGRIVKLFSINSSGLSAGSPLVWDCTDLKGERVSAGSYIFRAESEGGFYEGKIVLVR